jgi:hypothetical protein
MAIDFPNSPNPGQEFQGYYWDDTKQAWRSQSTNRGSVITSATTPTGATAGDLWFNTVDGTMYVYYDDGITTQWVEVQANVDNYKTPSQNYIINGGFDIWQRGTGSTENSGIYSNSDRWVSGSNSTTITRDADVPVGISQYSLKIVASSANSIYQRIEALNSATLAGKTVTFSFYYKRTSGTGNVDARFYFPSAIDNFGTVTQIGSPIVLSSAPSSVWTRYSATVTLPNEVNRGLQVLINNDGNTTSFIAGVQLEEGTIATPFRRSQPNIQAELAACLRYFNRYSFANGDLRPFITKLSPTGSGAGYGLLLLPVPMRVAPTTTFSAASTFQTHVPGIVINSPTSIVALTVDASPKSIQISTSGSSGFTFGQSVNLQWNSSGGGFINISAEL